MLLIVSVLTPTELSKSTCSLARFALTASRMKMALFRLSGSRFLILMSCTRLTMEMSDCGLSPPNSAGQQELKARTCGHCGPLILPKGLGPLS